MAAQREPVSRGASILRPVIDVPRACTYAEAMTHPITEPEGAAGSRPTSLVDEVANWLMDQALGDSEVTRLFEGCCERLLGAGLPLWRGHISFSVLHPLYGSTALTWRRGEEIETDNFPSRRDGPFPEEFLKSPLYHMVRTQVPFLRRRLLGDEANLDFPILSEFRNAGASDYLAYLISFGGGELNGMVGSWASDRPSGFSEQDVKSLLRIQQRLGVACKMQVKEQIARNVVTTYLGTLAGQRVLDGQIKRGDGEALSAAIWYSDLRGSTTLADTLSRDSFIQALNDYFECAAGAVLSQGGEILAFIGDAVLAIFPLDDAHGDAHGDAARACERALMASQDARERLATVNAHRAGEPLAFGLALHLGEVRFGNIGVPERVSFSVIGPTVNEVARLEALTKSLDRPVLASATFAAHVPAVWESLGEFALRGVGAPIQVLAPIE